MNKALQVNHSVFPLDCGQCTNLSQEINIQNMNIELVAQMFKNYQSNVLFHLEGLRHTITRPMAGFLLTMYTHSYG